MVNLKKIKRSIYFFLPFQFVVIIYTGCLEWLTSICNTSEKPEGASKEYYSTQCACNGISLIEMYDDGSKYKFLFDDSYAQEDDKLRIGFKNTKWETLDGLFLTWGSQTMPSRIVKNGELLTSIKKTLFTYKNKGVYSMCLKRNNDYDFNDINEVIITIYIENESDCKASFIIDDKGVNVYTNKCSQGSSMLVDSKHTGESVEGSSFLLKKNKDFLNDTKEHKSLQIDDTKKETNFQIKNCDQTQENQNKELEVENSFQFGDDDKRIESIMADESILKIFENDESIENRKQGEECDGMIKHFERTVHNNKNKNKECNKGNENVAKKENKDSSLDEFKDKFIYSDKKVSVSDSLDKIFLARLRSIVGSLQIYFETEDGKVIDEHIFKSLSKGDIKSGAFIIDIKKTFLRDKRFSMYPINKGGTRKCRIKIVNYKTSDFFYLINADNKEQPDIFFY